MKTLEQVIRYTRKCRFDDAEEWGQVLSFCKQHGIPGGYIHRALRPDEQADYRQFVNWYENCYGTGDVVGYGRTIGMIGDMLPSKSYLIAYLDYDGKLITQEMEIQPERIKPIGEEQIAQFRKALFDAGLTIDIKRAILTKLYTPEKFSYVSFENRKGQTNVGMFLESDGSNYRFAALWNGTKILMDCNVQCNFLLLRRSTNSEINLLHKKTSKAGWSYNVRTNQFTKRSAHSTNNAYWYMTDRFNITADKDNGDIKHRERFEAGNYFLDYTEAVTFMEEVKKLRN